MLKKFVNIENISRFKSFNASGDVELKRHSLLFGENGRGKTTVCAILRSLQTGASVHTSSAVRCLAAPTRQESGFSRTI